MEDRAKKDKVIITRLQKLLAPKYAHLLRLLMCFLGYIPYVLSNIDLWIMLKCYNNNIVM